MAGKAQKTQQELERTMIKLQKAAEALKTLEVKRKQLMEQTRIERLCSRGEILEGSLGSLSTISTSSSKQSRMRLTACCTVSAGSMRMFTVACASLGSTFAVGDP